MNYTKIISEKQYIEYCDILKNLIFENNPSEKEINILTNLIDEYDSIYFPIPTIDPIPLLKMFMEVHELGVSDLAIILEISEVDTQKILNEELELTDDNISKLCYRFKLSKNAFKR